MVLEQECWSGSRQTAGETGSQSIGFPAQSSKVKSNHLKEGTVPVLLQLRAASVTSKAGRETQDSWKKPGLYCTLRMKWPGPTCGAP